MVEYDRGDAMRIQHFIKVHDFAATIGRLETLDDETLFILESAAITHDIGIHKSEEKYGSSNGKYQEIEGPTEAQQLLQKIGGYTNEQIDRICWLVGHHHTYTDVDGLDYQILIEADFLVNIYEDNISKDAQESIRKNIFKTETGKLLPDNMFDTDFYKK